MKAFLCLIAAFIFIQIKSYSQWEKIYEFPLNQGFFDFDITENLSLFLVAENNIYKSTDMGLSWETSLIKSEGDGAFYGITFLGNDTGYIAKRGGPGLCRRTYNGGETWEYVYPAGVYNDYINDVFILNKDDIYFAGVSISGIVIISHDGCNITDLVYPDIFELSGLASIDCISVDTCFCISGNPYDLGGGGYEMYKSTDGGLSWFVNGYLTDGVDLTFTSKNIGYSLGNLELKKTINQGETWEVVKHVDAIGNDITAMKFINDTVGYLAEQSNLTHTSVVYFTENGGISWQLTEFDTVQKFPITTIDCIDANNCFLATANGSIYKTSSGGISSINSPLQNSINLTLYPNPSSNQLNIICSESIKTLSTQNILGQTMPLNYIKTNATNYKIDVTELPTGIYFTQITTANGSCSKQWVKE